MVSFSGLLLGLQLTATLADHGPQFDFMPSCRAGTGHHGTTGRLTSVLRSSLETILPAEPTGRITEQPFHARLSDRGKRHPVTRGLHGAQSDPPHWSRWFRLIESTSTPGSTAVMDGPDGKPLLVLSREREGRVALLLSDHEYPSNTS